jgi:hypothetical protein
MLVKVNVGTRRTWCKKYVKISYDMIQYLQVVYVEYSKRRHGKLPIITIVT